MDDVAHVTASYSPKKRATQDIPSTERDRDVARHSRQGRVNRGSRAVTAAATPGEVRPVRDMLLVSHANPEDNAFARWITLRLTATGYPVWCDLTKLLGGERFWTDIEEALRTRTIKFLYVLSKHSNDKPGPRDELDLALKVQRDLGLRDFVVPLWIDDLPSSQFNIRVGPINAIPFCSGWATGLATLLDKLEADHIPKRPELGPAVVTDWWREHLSARQGVRDVPEQEVSNWYPIGPTTLYFHELTRRGIGSLKPPADLPYPAISHSQYLVTFAPADDFADCLGPDLSIASTVTRRLNDAASANEPRLWSFGEERAALTQLLRAAWQALLSSRGLPTHAFANQALGYYFRKDFAPGDRVSFTGPGGTASWRNMVGYKTVGHRGGVPSLRYWHFCLEAKPTSSPMIGYTMRPHVLFSDDGHAIWESPDRLHKARRSQCANWWNDRWRDLIGAAVSWLADRSNSVELPVGRDATLNVSTVPVLLTSPVSFDDTALAAETVLTDDVDGEAAEGDIDDAEWTDPDESPGEDVYGA